MIKIKKKEQCCGCTACINICPVNAISLQPDFEGFLYPIVNENKCISCGKCDQCCPVLNKKEVHISQHRAVCMRAKDKVIVDNSTSGGFFTPLAEYVLNNEGIVYGAAFSDNKKIEHIRIDRSNRADISKLRGSKYVQSDLKLIFTEILGLLKKDILICFSGTPCQVAGLKNYLNKEYPNLITVDVICHGTPSPLLWDKYVQYQESKYNSSISSVSFRKKKYGYHSGTMELIFLNGKKYYGSARIDYMLKSFFSEISSRPSCYQCAFKSADHVSDFTIFDCWSAQKLVEGLKDDDRGYTNVFINSQKGELLFNRLRDQYISYSVDFERAIKLDGSMVRSSAVPHPKREEFYKEIGSESLPDHIQKFIPVSPKDYLVEKLKAILYKIGILRFIKTIVK